MQSPINAVQLPIVERAHLGIYTTTVKPLILVVRAIKLFWRP